MRRVISAELDKLGLYESYDIGVNPLKTMNYNMKITKSAVNHYCKKRYGHKNYYMYFSLKKMNHETIKITRIAE